MSCERAITILTHFKQIPYENISKIFRLGLKGDRRPRTPRDLFSNYEDNGWGGTCFSLTWAAVSKLREAGIEARIMRAHMPRRGFPHFALSFKCRGYDQFSDPGYMIFGAVRMDKNNENRYSNDVMAYRCRWNDENGYFDMFSVQDGKEKLRYSIDPQAVGDDEFREGWIRSFEYMNAPVLSRIIEGKFIYIAGNYAQIRTRNHSERYEGRDKINKLISYYFSFSEEEVSLARKILEKYRQD